MSILANAPLIEVIFELRWGKITRDKSNTVVGFQFSQEESQFFFGQFKSVAEAEDFKHIERINPNITNPLPHIITHRFRKAPNTWPCIQIGLGVFTVNQLVEGYDWHTFKKDCLFSIELLDKGHPLKLEGLSEEKIGIQLRYQDAFLFSENERAIDFLKNKLNIGFGEPKDFVEYENFTPLIKGIQFAFNVDVKKPKGVLNISIQEGLINDSPGILMDTILRSPDSDTPEFSTEIIDKWLEDAHIIQKYAFESLINPTYLKSFR
jgi:uncharacterized protein (TIGR04255 family)